MNDVLARSSLVEEPGGDKDLDELERLARPSGGVRNVRGPADVVARRLVRGLP
jgi:hypothetical protein